MDGGFAFPYASMEYNRFLTVMRLARSCACLLVDLKNMNEIVASVDRAMYAAKHNGRNRVECAINHDTVGPCRNIVKIA